MADDIVKELKDWAFIVDGVQGKASVMMLSGEIFSEAADEIERLRNTLTVIADAVKSIDGELPGGSAYAIGRIRVELMEALYD